MRVPTSEFVTRLKKIKFPAVVDKLVLFGSEVYGSPRVGSDIDLAVVSSTKLSQEEKHLIEDLIEMCSPPFECQIVFVTFGEYRQGFDVRKDIFEKGIVI